MSASDSEIKKIQQEPEVTLTENQVKGENPSQIGNAGVPNWGPLGGMLNENTLIMQTDANTCAYSLLSCLYKNYQICNSLGQPILLASEDENCYAKAWCSTLRGFRMVVKDTMMQEIIIERPCTCWCTDALRIYCPPGNLLGSVKKRFSCSAKLDILDPQGSLLFHIKGPGCPSCECKDTPIFTVLDKDKMSEIGAIKKLFVLSGKSYMINFPIDMDPRIKALFLAAAILIDFTYFD